MNNQNSPAEGEVLSKSEMNSFYLEDPKNQPASKELNNTKMQYFYFKDDLKLVTKENEVLNGCLLSGDATLMHDGASQMIKQFDFFFLPPEQELVIKLPPQTNQPHKICSCSYSIEEKVKAHFEVQHFYMEKFIPRGEHGSETKMATYRTVWTAIKNGYFMSGFTNIPNESLKQGVITSVNLEKDDQGRIEVYPHIHPEYPEVYIMCIDDENYAISQYLINVKGESICKDLTNGEGLFFPGSLGHSNFSRPLYRDLKYCMYMWIIPTFGMANTVNPITLKS